MGTKKNYGQPVISLVLLFSVLAAHSSRAEDKAEKNGFGTVTTVTSAEDAVALEKSRAEFAEYNKLQNKVSQLKQQTDEAQKKVEQLLADKRLGVKTVKGEKGAEENLLEAIQKSYKAFIEKRNEYNTELRLLTDRYPHRGQDIRRRYRAYREVSLDEIDTQLGLEGILSELKIFTFQKYGFQDPLKNQTDSFDSDSAGLRQPASVDGAHDPQKPSGPQRLKLSK